MFDGSPQALRDVAVGTNFGTKIIPFRGHAVVAYMYYNAMRCSEVHVIYLLGAVVVK